MVNNIDIEETSLLIAHKVINYEHDRKDGVLDLIKTLALLDYSEIIDKVVSLSVDDYLYLESIYLCLITTGTDQCVADAVSSIMKARSTTSYLAESVKEAHVREEPDVDPITLSLLAIKLTLRSKKAKKLYTDIMT